VEFGDNVQLTTKAWLAKTQVGQFCAIKGTICGYKVNGKINTHFKGFEQN